MHVKRSGAKRSCETVIRNGHPKRSSDTCRHMHAGKHRKRRSENCAGTLSSHAGARRRQRRSESCAGRTRSDTKHLGSGCRLGRCCLGRSGGRCHGGWLGRWLGRGSGRCFGCSLGRCLGSHSGCRRSRCRLGCRSGCRRRCRLGCRKLSRSTLAMLAWSTSRTNEASSRSMRLREAIAAVTA